MENPAEDRGIVRTDTEEIMSETAFVMGQENPATGLLR